MQLNRLGFKTIFKNKNIKVFFENFLALMANKVVNIIVPLIVLPYLIVTVGAENYGEYAFIYSIVFYLLTITQYGFSLSAVKAVSRNKHNPYELNKIFNNVISTKLFLFLLTTLIIVVAFIILGDNNSKGFILLTTYLIVLGDVLNPIWFFQGIEKMRNITVVNSILKTTYLVLVFVFIKEKGDYIYIGLLQSIGFVLSGVISLLIAIKNYNLKIKLSKISVIKEYLIKGFSSFVTLIVPSLYVNTSIFFMGILGFNVHVTYFESAYKISNGFASISQILSNVFYPFASRVKNRFKKIRNILLTTGLLLTIVCFLGAEIIYGLLFSNHLDEGVIVLRILSLTPLILSIRSAYGLNYLLVNNKDVLYMKIAIFSSISGFIIGLISIPLYKSLGAAFAVVIAQGVFGLLSYIYTNRILKNLNFKNK